MFQCPLCLCCFGLQKSKMIIWNTYYWEWNIIRKLKLVVLQHFVCVYHFGGGGKRGRCLDICHNNSHRYQFSFVFTLKFGENVFQAHGAQPPHAVTFCDGRVTKTGQALSNFSTNRYLRHALSSGCKQVHQTDAKCIWICIIYISVKGCGDGIWVGAGDSQSGKETEGDWDRKRS